MRWDFFIGETFNLNFSLAGPKLSKKSQGLSFFGQ
jgi:hypothetical protein